MNLQSPKLGDAEREDYKRRIAKRYGEIVPLAWTDLVEQVVEEEYEEQLDKKTAVTKKRKVKQLVPVDKVAEHYVGRLEPGQTGRMMLIMYGLFQDATSAGKEFDINGIMSTLVSLDGTVVTGLLATILKEEDAWVEENFDIKWMMQVLPVFLNPRYNDFFALVEQFLAMLQNMGVTEEKIQGMVQKVKGFGQTN